MTVQSSDFKKNTNSPYPPPALKMVTLLDESVRKIRSVPVFLNSLCHNDELNGILIN